MLKNVKMSTVVGILTFISMINKKFESLKARKVFIFQHFSFYEQLQYRTQMSWTWKKFYNLGPRSFRLFYQTLAYKIIFLNLYGEDAFFNL